jgi:hypothetical protein
MEWYSKGEPALFIAIDIAEYGGKDLDLRRRL